MRGVVSTDVVISGFDCTLKEEKKKRLTRRTWTRSVETAIVMALTRILETSAYDNHDVTSVWSKLTQKHHTPSNPGGGGSVSSDTSVTTCITR